MSSEKTLNEVFSSLSARRRYEVWFVRLGLTDGSAAWWFRYLLITSGTRLAQGMRLQVWATRFPAHAAPETFIEEFPQSEIDLSPRGQHPFHLRGGENGIDENSCRGELRRHGHRVSWNLHYRSTFRVTLSDKGWIGFSRTPHSDGIFSGRITFDDETLEGDPLGWGVQGHNCGYKHRDFWVWTHAYFLPRDGAASTLEALVYDMPLGLVFRKAVLWHRGRPDILRDLRETRRDPESLRWELHGSTSENYHLEFAVDGGGRGLHRLVYQKTDGSGTLSVLNNSLARAQLCLRGPTDLCERLSTATGAVLEMAGNVRRIG